MMHPRNDADTIILHKATAGPAFMYYFLSAGISATRASLGTLRHAAIHAKPHGMKRSDLVFQLLLEHRVIVKHARKVITRVEMFNSLLCSTTSFDSQYLHHIHVHRK
ncbi:uncharacterized protein K460DRAFT_70214 [Cucurbitaria berberidis CBS 394.84]|uniref:Uncharacterized protein n=1 Tax=Cucurbitaria berberidis CBS 394.84 TaxID=1168544 RepID=A0A9P4GMB0_9PLEO|nr:uncharacterized protein K460DRAFT_70214 [Cucurbitaria berberidis CBS 394.84]KAF1848267.1 hypothetical protein K460DRAFT_70214 [Cucurbitaria berberidis CBS 394.84]